MPSDEELCDALGDWVAARCWKLIGGTTKKWDPYPEVKEFASRIYYNTGKEDLKIDYTKDGRSLLFLFRTIENPDWPTH